MDNNPKYRQQWILDSLKVNPMTSYNEMFTIYLLSFTNLSRQTFNKDWMVSTKLLKSYQKEINSAKLAQSIKSEKQAVKNGLKTKFDRLMILQNQVDQCLDQLTSRQCDDVYIFDGSAISYKRNMNQREINDTRKTLNTLQIEISKIEGDYAIIKTENTNIEIKPLEFRVLNKDDN